MPSVARAQGLIVNKTKDERKDFNRSAFGAASLLKKICIPETKNILEKHPQMRDHIDRLNRQHVMKYNRWKLYSSVE